MKTSWFSRYVIPVLLYCIFAIAGFGLATILHAKAIAEVESKTFQLEKEHWHCFVGKLFDTGFECFIYKRKDADFGPHSNSRRGDDNLPKGKPVQQKE